MRGDKVSPAEVRKLLQYYDAKEISDGEFESAIEDAVLDPIWKAIEEHGEIITLGSCCCASHPPERNMKVEITIQAHGFTIKKID